MQYVNSTGTVLEQYSNITGTLLVWYWKRIGQALVQHRSEAQQMHEATYGFARSRFETAAVRKGVRCMLPQNVLLT